MFFCNDFMKVFEPQPDEIKPTSHIMLHIFVWLKFFIKMAVIHLGAERVDSYESNGSDSR